MSTQPEEQGVGVGGGQLRKQSSAFRRGARLKKRRGGAVGYVPPGVTTHETQNRRKQRHNMLSTRCNYSFCPPGVPRGSEAVLTETHTEFEQPALPVRVEEGVREVVPVVLRDLEGFVFDAVVQVLQEVTSRFSSGRTR